MKIDKDFFIKNKDKIPALQGYFTLQNCEDKVLYAAISSNLQRTVWLFFQQAKENENILQITSLSQTIAFSVTETLMEALLAQKEIIAKHHPAYQNSLSLVKEYVYLGFDFDKAPFINVVEDTQKDLLYVGPFQRRFFLLDAMQIFADVFHYPFCEDKNFPCTRLKENQCAGFCLKEPEEWQKIIFSSYLQKNQAILNQLKILEHSCYNNLQFNEAEIWKQQTEHLEKYYRYIIFFRTVKKISLSINCYGKNIRIERGQITEMSENGDTFSFPFSQLTYRENEHFAIEKTQLDEAWIVFQYLYFNEKKLIDRIYQESVQSLQEK